MKTAFALLFWLLLSIAPSASETPSANATTSISTDDVLRNARKSFGLDDKARLTAQPLKLSAIAGFYKTRFSLESDETSSSFDAFVAADQSFLIIGQLRPFVFPATDHGREDIARHLHIKAAEIKSIKEKVSVFTDLTRLEITVIVNGRVQKRSMFKTRKGGLLILGWLYPLLEDAAPRELRHTMKTAGQIAEGDSKAPVILIEYADLACPSCATMSKLLRNEVIPQFGRELRIVYKEFPLVSMHPWAFQGAVAAQCVFTVAPKQAVAFRNLILEHQSELTEENALEKELALTDQLGVARDKVAGCVKSQRTAQRVYASLDEAESIAVAGTPTIFVNGERLAGDVTAAHIKDAISKALRQVEHEQQSTNAGVR